MADWKEELKHKKVPIPYFINNKIRCYKCGSSMELIGITSSRMWKYYCNNCYTFVVTEDGDNDKKVL